MLFAFSGEEDQAIKDLGKAGFVPRARRLAKLLTEHLICRQQLSSKTGRRDGVAHISLSKVRLAADRPLDPVGIKLSACLIVKNESKNLSRCLESLKGIVDEIVVVDTGSTDDTVAIAESFGAKMGSFEWSHDFSAARNHSLEIATGDWVLWIDADEVLVPESVSAIQRALVRPHFGGFAI
ncbi:MAG: glycosyltransferase family 2 protein, partial [Chlorobia bacterium]|nr:glycosyltransferase family 2 protein [Fimbriimonadaceae bacterium]